MINTENFKKLLIDKYDSIKFAAEKLGTTEQNIYRMIRDGKVSMKFLEKVAKASRVSVPDLLNMIEKGSSAPEKKSSKADKDLIAKLEAELAETKEKLMKSNEELIQFYRKNI